MDEADFDNWTSEDFTAWRRRMGFTAATAADVLGQSKNQPHRYEKQGAKIPRYIAIACTAIEAGIGYTRPET